MELWIHFPVICLCVIFLPTRRAKFSIVFVSLGSILLLFLWNNNNNIFTHNLPNLRFLTTYGYGFILWGGHQIKSNVVWYSTNICTNIEWVNLEERYICRSQFCGNVTLMIIFLFWEPAQYLYQLSKINYIDGLWLNFFTFNDRRSLMNIDAKCASTELANWMEETSNRLFFLINIAFSQRCRDGSIYLQNQHYPPLKSRKFIWQYSRSLDNENVAENRACGNIPQDYKVDYSKSIVNREIQSILTKIRTKTRMPTLSTPIQSTVPFINIVDDKHSWY